MPLRHPPSAKEIRNWLNTNVNADPVSRKVMCKPPFECKPQFAEMSMLSSAEIKSNLSQQMPSLKRLGL